MVVARTPVGAERRRVAAGGHQPEHGALPVRRDAEVEPVDAVGREALVGRDDAEHAVGPLDARERRHEHVGDGPDARVDVVDGDLGLGRRRARRREQDERDGLDERVHAGLRS